MLEWLEPVEHQEAAMLADQPGERSSLLGGIGEAWAGVPEVGERLLEEELGGGVPLLVASLAIEGVDEDPAGAAVAVVAHLGEPFRHDAGFARSAFGVENEDAGAFVPGLVEGGELGLAAGEAFAVGAQDFQAVGGVGHGGSGTLDSGGSIL
ncbi:MAG: hypothetical protein DMF53_25855 [Acidobacteria bacterium]|nr:MAG: hypothetical protein DMF53_25855 [Acidobacteriota bacterium]